MKALFRGHLVLVTCAVLWLVLIAVALAAPPATGPETENRFPPLKVPAGFTATLFACDPLIEYPSAIALGPRPNSLFVVADFMTGLGTDIIRRDEIRLIEDTDGDGYADKATVYADQFNSIEGLTFHGDTVYAMHAPLLTALRDTDGDGKADERRDLLSGLGLTPEENPVRLHCANGLVMGHDGWLYLALGDHGCNVMRPEGDRLVFEGGGILRCRPDGRDLHVFARGLRNIYDVALDDDLNVFVRDNENDGGDYKIRVCHSFFGADHGYPYQYYERPEEALPPLADLGLGSSAGGVCYRERQFPPEYRGNLFFCEWGRSVVRYRPERSGTGFGRVTEIEFAAGAESDPYGFKPTDLVVDRNGSLIVADWADGQRPKRGRGRIYRIAYADDKAGAGREIADSRPRSLVALIAQLDSESAFKRVQAQEAISARGPDGVTILLEAIGRKSIGVVGRMHAVWVFARASDRTVLEKLFDLARSDPDIRVQAQAVRALADLADPVLVRHRLDAGAGDREIAARLAALAEGKKGPVVLEVVIALGRLRWSNAPDWLAKTLSARLKPTEESDRGDPALTHAAMETLRRAANWPGVLRLLDQAGSEPRRQVALSAIADQAEPQIVDGLIERLGLSPAIAEGNQRDQTARQTDVDPVRRREYADILTRVHKKPAPWVYWGYRPPPRPANSVAWERTEAIERALDHVLADRDGMVRLAVLLRMQREKIPTRLATLAAWLKNEREPAATAAILDSLREHPAANRRELLAAVVTEAGHTPASRTTALRLLAGSLDQGGAGQLLELAGIVEDGPVAAEVIRQLRRQPALNSGALLIRKLRSSDADVRTAAVETLAELRLAAAGDAVQPLLADKVPAVRQAAAAAVGRLAVRSAIEPLLRLAADSDPDVRRNSLDALRLLREPRAVVPAVAALADRQTQLSALELLGDLGGPGHAAAVIDLANREPSTSVLTPAVRLLAKWSGDGELPAARRTELEQAVARLQGQSGVLVRWEVTGPMSEPAATQLLEMLAARGQPAAASPDPLSGWRTVFATGLDSRVNVADKAAATTGAAQGERVWLAAVDLTVAEATPVQFFGGAAGKLQVWLNGRRIYRRDEERPFQPDSDRFDGALGQGANRLVVQVTAPRDPAEFHVRFRRKSSLAELEQFSQAALARSGDPERGRKLFFDNEKLQCSKCHRVGDQGERIGPELTGVGERFSRIHIVESILEPSRTVATGFQTISVVLRDGRVLTGIKVAETEAMLTLGDNQAKTHALAKADIEEQKTQPQSTMPEGLVKQLTVDQFVDLIGYLAGLKENRGPR